MSHERSGGNYGLRRVWLDVVEAGFEVGRERIAQLMRFAGIGGDVPKKRRKISGNELLIL